MLKRSVATFDASVWAIRRRISLRLNGSRLTAAAELHVARSYGPFIKKRGHLFSDSLLCQISSVRGHSIPIDAVAPQFPAMAGLLAGGMVSAFYGARLVSRLSNQRLVLFIAVLLGALGLALIAEGFFPLQSGDLLPFGVAAHVAVGAGIGIGVGLVSSVLGVAGGELLIPALVLIFGADIKTAGSASILISLGIVLIGLWRHWRAKTIPLGRGAQRITTAMAAGSIVGAILGGLAVAYAPVVFLKVLLGCVLLAAAGKTNAQAVASEQCRDTVHTAGRSRRTSTPGLSSRSPRYTTCRSKPASVHVR